MNFLISEDLKQLRSTLRDLFGTKFGGDKLRNFLQQSVDPESIKTLRLVWRELVELGVLTGGTSERSGGLGLGLLADLILLMESGRVVSPLPVLEQMVFGIAPLRASASNGESIKKELATALSGEKIYSGYIRGDVVPSIEWADIILVERQNGKSISLSKMQNFGANVATSSLDLIRSYSKHPALERTIQITELSDSESSYLRCERLLFLAAEILGAARAVESMTLEYVKTRKQFGSPIGSFQVVQHKLADVHVNLEGGESLLYFAGWARVNDIAQFELAARGAYVHIVESATLAIEQCLQLHGGIGFTYEYDLHLYLRRVISLAGWFGSVGEVSLELAKIVTVTTFSETKDREMIGS